MNSIVITALGYVDGRNCGSHDGALSWDGTAPAPGAMRWSMFSGKPFDRFGRLSWMAKYVAIAVEMLGLPAGPEPESKLSAGILLGTRYGSMSVDARFNESTCLPGGASPTLFPYTLPSASLGEVAIRFGLTGPSICFVGGPQSARTVLWESVDMVESGIVDTCVCVSCDAVRREHAFLTCDMSSDGDPVQGRAHAMLIETASAAARADRKPLASVRIDTATSPSQAGSQAAPHDDQEMTAALCAFLSKAGDAQASLRIDAPQALGTEQSIALALP